MYSYIFFLIFIVYLAVLSQLQHVGSSVFMEICRTFSCHTWDLVPQPGSKHWPSSVGTQSLSRWTTREVRVVLLSNEDLLFLSRLPQAHPNDL